MLAGTALLPALLVVSHAHELLTNEEEFVGVFAPLAKDPGLQAHIARSVVEQVDIPGVAARMEEEISGLTGADVPALEVPGWLSDSAEILGDWGVPSWLTDPLVPSEEGGPVTMENLTSELVTTIEDGIMSALALLADTETFSIGWQEGLRSSHTQILEQFSESPFGRAHPPLTVDIQPIAAAVKESLMSSGAPYARHIPTDWGYTILLIPGEEMSTTAPIVSLALKYGPWAPWIALCIASIGLTLVKRRGLWFTIGATIVALTSAGLLTAASRWQADANSIEGIVYSAFVDALAPPASTSLVALMSTALASAVVGGILTLLLSRRARSARRAH